MYTSLKTNIVTRDQSDNKHEQLNSIQDQNVPLHSNATV